MVFDEDPLYVMSHFLVFKILSLSFDSFDYNVSQCRSLSLIYLEFIELFEHEIIIFFITFGKLSALFL